MLWSAPEVIDQVAWVLFASLYGVYDGVMYAMFDWSKPYYLAGRIHVPHLIAWLIRALVAVAIFMPADLEWLPWLLDVLGAALVFALLHTGFYGVTRGRLDVHEYGFLMHQPRWEGWVSIWPDRNFYMRLGMAIGGLLIWYRGLLN